MTDRSSSFSRGASDLSDLAKWLNVSGSTIPAYGVVQFKANFAAGYNQASKSNGESGLYFVNGPVDVPNGAHGESLIWNHSRLVLISGDPDVGEVVGPTAGSWEMSSSGVGFIVLHQPVDGIGAVVQLGGGGGTVNLIHGIVHACLGEGYYEVEISEWSGRTPDQESSGSGSCNVCSFVAPAGSSSGGCTEDPPLPDFADSDSEEDNVIKRQTTGTGVIVLAYDPGSIFIPLVVGSDCRMTNTGEENPTVGTEDDSQSSGNTEPVYQIVRGHQEHLKLYREVWDCCNGQDTLISRKAIIFPGVECPEEVCTVCE